ncbi:hypothetical protein [Tropicimonas sp. IMCC6043]|uniref:hypothetical protein n=1 Tax=Tropicimonas sp. IMCC6043 TaxID=2510645 RepID=UPI0013EA8B4C|nr:hypothetical protein [Tropicimonas sp. IMCC6043]
MNDTPQIIQQLGRNLPDFLALYKDCAHADVLLGIPSDFAAGASSLEGGDLD